MSDGSSPHGDIALVGIANYNSAKVDGGRNNINGSNNIPIHRYFYAAEVVTTDYSAILGRRYIVRTNGEYDVDTFGCFFGSDYSTVGRYSTVGKTSHINIVGDTLSHQMQRCAGLSANGNIAEVNALFVGLDKRQHVPLHRYHKLTASVGRIYIEIGCEHHKVIFNRYVITVDGECNVGTAVESRSHVDIGC